MFTITRRLALQFRSVFRRAFGSRGPGPAVCFIASPGMLTVRASCGDVAIEYRAPHEHQGDETVWAPMQLLDDCGGKRDDPVQVEVAGKGQVTAQWRDGSVPQLIRYDVPLKSAQHPFPQVATQFADNPPTILAALHDAVKTTDQASVRYATACIQLRGRDGSIRATDGRQLLAQTGFSLPWTDDVLIPGVNVFGCGELPLDQPVRIGRSEDWATFVIGPWTIHVRINKDGRFPDLDRHVAQPASVTARLRLSQADAAFLSNAIPKLPNDDQYHDPVTLDLNGSVSVRAKGADQTHPTEVVLSGSSYQGEPVRIQTNRQFLARALRLGFRELHVVSNTVPVVCRDEGRAFAWALLDPASAIGPSSNAVRIESPLVDSPTIPINRIKRNHTTVNDPTPNQDTPAKADCETKPNGQARKLVRRKADRRDAAALIEQAEKFRAATRELGVQAAELVKALKQHRRQNRLVASTLRQLKTIGV